MEGTNYQGFPSQVTAGTGSNKVAMPKWSSTLPSHKHTQPQPQPEPQTPTIGSEIRFCKCQRQSTHQVRVRVAAALRSPSPSRCSLARLQHQTQQSVRPTYMQDSRCPNGCMVSSQRHSNLGLPALESRLRPNPTSCDVADSTQPQWAALRLGAQRQTSTAPTRPSC